MWRHGVAVILLMLLVALVADMWFGISAGLGDAYRHDPLAASDRQGEYQPAPNAVAVASSSAIVPATVGRPKGGTNGASGAEPAPVHGTPSKALPTQDPNGTLIIALDQLDLTRLPRATGDGMDRHGPGAPTNQTAALTGDPPAGATDPAPAKDAAAGVRPPPAAEVQKIERAEPTRRPVPTPAAPTARTISEVQRKLIALGYDVGQADGRMGRRTDAAVRDFQKTARMTVDGRIDERLLARLDAEVRNRSLLRQQELEVMAPAPRKKPEPELNRSVFGSVMGGFQRLLGRDFDSVRRPGELTAYCRGNADTWIYDFGREAFVYCGNVIAGGLGGQAPAQAPVQTPGHSRGQPAETAANP